jgi:superfamily II DNA/RNA helicase
LSCSELIDRLYRCESTELPAQIVAVSATVDGDSAARLNAWMRNDSVTRLTTSVEEQSVPDTLQFYFACEHLPQFPMHKLLKLFLQHIACQTLKPRILIFADEKDFDINDLVRFVSEIPKYPRQVIEGGRSWLEPERWKVVSLMSDFESGDESKKSERKRIDEKTPIQSPLASKRKIIGRNGEIFCFNDSNLSKLESFQAQIGVADFSLARGLHIANVSHVIIFGDVPGSSEFLHCSGRTGRRGKTGEVISIFSPSAGRNLKSICETLNIPWHVVRAADVEKTMKHSAGEILMEN